MRTGGTEPDDNGKAERFRRLALPHLDAVYTLARYLTRNRSDADDAVQECYLRAFRYFDTFRGGEIKPWLLSILRNVCHGAYVETTRLVYGDDAQTAAAADPVWREQAETPEQAALRRGTSDAMRRLIGQLPPEFREVIVLREIEDLSYRDIAAAIDAPIGTVMSRLARARGLLRAAWIASGDAE